MWLSLPVTIDKSFVRRECSVVDSGLDPLSCQIRDYTIGVWCFSAYHTALRSMNKDYIRIICPSELLFQWARTIAIQLIVLVYSAKGTLSSSHQNIYYSRYDMADQFSLCAKTTFTHSPTRPPFEWNQIL